MLYSRNLTEADHEILHQGPSSPLRRIPKPSPEPPQRHPMTNRQRHKLPNLTILHNIINNRQRRIRQLDTHRMLKDRLHLKPDIVPAKINRRGRAPLRLLLDLHHFLQQIEQEELVLDAGAPPCTDFWEPQMAVDLSFDGVDGH